MRSRQPALAHQTGSDHLSGQPRLRPVWKMLFITSVAINLVGILGLGYVIYKNKSYIKNWYSEISKIPLMKVDGTNGSVKLIDKRL
jgi:hypothetical protein